MRSGISTQNTYTFKRVYFYHQQSNRSKHMNITVSENLTPDDLADFLLSLEDSLLIEAFHLAREKNHRKINGTFLKKQVVHFG